jgi:hypothetical protein
MKRLFFYLISIVLIVSTGCNDDSGGSTITDPFGGGGTGGQGSASFTISTTNGQQGGIIFTATPSVDVKITQVTVSLPAQQFTDVLQGDGTTVFSANQAALLEEYVGVERGQQWTFKFEGTLANGGQTFSVTSNYTIP